MSGAKPDKKGGGGNGKGKDTFVATTAGFVFFTGIAVSLFKAFKSKKLVEEEKTNDVVKEVNIFGFHKGGNKKKSSQTIEVFKGDTLWSLSRKYGVELVKIRSPCLLIRHLRFHHGLRGPLSQGLTVSVDKIKAANKYADDTIYAGEKLIIP